ncbi:nucleotidyltransferase family protein [Formosa sp. S-31]|uniref:nucleotidyltransferase family protein n=1 Tax=Formosa sp. S-31 TaxID=2790949 RepID=UPI003EBEF466
MNSTEQTLQHLAKILNFENNAKALQKAIQTNEIDWEAVIAFGSNHLVIPTLYSRLCSKGLLKDLPEDLYQYQKYIYDLNLERNKALLQEVHMINNWFNQADIPHVFLKGAAMIASDYYNNIGERMLGDIDVLVPKHLCQKAFDLLLSKGYNYAKTPTINPKYFEDKHLLRLASEAFLGAVEIHFKLLDTDQDILQPQAVLDERILTKNTNIPIPCTKHLLIHNVLNFQVNDLGSYYNFIGLKNVYDTLVLLPHVSEPEHKYALSNKHIVNNFNLGRLYFNVFPKPKTTALLKLKAKVYRLKNRYPKFRTLHYKTLSYLQLSQLLSHRIWFFIKNKHYRTDVLNDRKRILKFIKSKL